MRNTTKELRKAAIRRREALNDRLQKLIAQRNTLNARIEELQKMTAALDPLIAGFKTDAERAAEAATKPVQLGDADLLALSDQGFVEALNAGYQQGLTREKWEALDARTRERHAAAWLTVTGTVFDPAAVFEKPVAAATSAVK